MSAGRGLAAALLLATSAAAAQKPPPVRSRGFSPYELRVIADQLVDRKDVIDEMPEGKLIERIDVVPLDVVQPSDPAPEWLNKLRRTSRAYVIEREVLLRPGDPYRQVMADESARNLRALPQLSLAACIPVRSSKPGHVRLLVVTKDVWSLRPGAEASFSGGGLERVSVTPSEFNIAGLHHTATVRYEALPASFSLGARYLVPRLWGTRYYGSLEWNVIFNQKTGSPEGTFGVLTAGRPLFSTVTPWGLEVNLSTRSDITRRYVNARVSTYDAPSTPGNDNIPFEYRDRNHAARLLFTRSYGWAIKHDFALGAEATYRATSVPALPGVDPRALDEFRRTSVPKTDHRIGPVFSYRTYTTDFNTVLDYDVLGLQEDVRLGHDLSAKIYPAPATLGSSRNLVGMQLGASYTFPLADGFARVALSSLTEREQRRTTDAYVAAVLGIVTPRLGFGRIFFSAGALQRLLNFRNDLSVLGGDTTLRGYPSGYFSGKDFISYNFEFRSRPVEIMSAQLGIALFHDVGDAYNGAADLRLRRSVGLGLRALFPQLGRTVFRADLGIPLTIDDLAPPVAPVDFFISFGQAFKITPLRAGDGRRAGARPALNPRRRRPSRPRGRRPSCGAACRRRGPRSSRAA